MAAQETTGKKTAKKSTNKKAANKKSTTGSTGKKAASSAAKSTTQQRSQRTSAPRAEAPKRRSGVQVADEAVRQLAELAGKEVEAVTGLERTDDGWRVEVEVLELRRVPDTTDVLATYQVTTDEDGELEGYHRSRRYVRGTPGEDDR